MPATGNQLPQLLTITELARHLGVSVRHVRRLVSERRIPYIKWGHLLRFDPDEVLGWLQAAHVDASRVGQREALTPRSYLLRK